MNSPSVSLQIAPCFAVPMAIAQHPDPGPLNLKLRELFLSRESEGAKHRNPDPSMKTTDGVFESEFHLFETEDARIVELREFCFRVLMRVVAELNGFDTEFTRQLRIHASAWFHVTRNGGAFGVHNHAMASWSGVYCVDPGDGNQILPDSGLLSFVNPAATAAMFLDSTLANVKAPFNLKSREFKLQAGDLVIFPSWLLHQVTSHRGPKERITVAFNAWFRTEPARTPEAAP